MRAMRPFAIEEISIPGTIDAADAADFVETVEVSNVVDSFEYGSTEMSSAPGEALLSYTDAAFQPRRAFAARIGGRIAARAIYETLTAEPDVAWMNVAVLPQFRGDGLGTALADLVEEVGRRMGRTRLLSSAVAADRPGDRLVPPTGFGSVSINNPGVRFLLGRGFSLEQVARVSRLVLPLDRRALQLRFSEALATSGPDYDLHHWIDHTPPCWLSDMAELYTSMSTEQPSAGLEEPPNVWTVQRVLDSEARLVGSGAHRLVVVVEHRPSAHLVGYTVLSVPGDVSRTVGQLDTLVLPGHRGHRLGMLLKVANLLQLHTCSAGHPAVVTFNAEENRPMLNVNEPLGFIPIAYEGCWKKMLV